MNLHENVKMIENKMALNQCIKWRPACWPGIHLSSGHTKSNKILGGANTAKNYQLISGKIRKSRPFH